MAFLVQVQLRGHGIERAARRTAAGAPWEVLLGLHTMTVRHAALTYLDAPGARLDGPWPVVLTIGMERHQESRLRDALAPVLGDRGYVLESAGTYLAGRPAWHLGVPNLMDAVRVGRAAPWAPLVGERWRGRDG